MVEEFGADILQEPTQIIAFVAHALDAKDRKSIPKKVHQSRPPISGIGMNDLKIVVDEEEEEVRDDEDENAGLGLGPDEMILTALTLLLAVLEGKIPYFIRSEFCRLHSYHLSFFSQRGSQYEYYAFTFTHSF